MWKITEIAVYYGRTTNTGNYESLRHEAHLTATLEGGEDIDVAFAQLFEAAKSQVRRRVYDDHATFASDWPR